MVNKVMLSFATLTIAVASAASSHRVTISEPVNINGSIVQPGDYRVEVSENMAILKKGKTVIEAPVKVEQSDEKYPATSLRVTGKDLDEIRFGGTHTRVVFEKPGASTNE